MNDELDIGIVSTPLIPKSRRFWNGGIKDTKLSRAVCERCREYLPKKSHITGPAWFCDVFGLHMNERRLVSRDCLLLTEQMVSQ